MEERRHGVGKIEKEKSEHLQKPLEREKKEKEKQKTQETRRSRGETPGERTEHLTKPGDLRTQEGEGTYRKISNVDSGGCGEKYQLKKCMKCSR